MKRSHTARPRILRSSPLARKSGGSSGSSSSNIPNLLVMLAVSIGSFFAGTLVSWQTTTQQQDQQQNSCPSPAEIDEIISQRVQTGTFEFLTRSMSVCRT
jgi:ABC-type nitrate/sulfonate/bicarbonate transport system permease component